MAGRAVAHVPHRGGAPGTLAPPSVLCADGGPASPFLCSCPDFDCPQVTESTLGKAREHQLSVTFARGKKRKGDETALGVWSPQL